MEDIMKNIKKILFAGTMALALTTPSLLPTTSYADSPNTSVSEEDQYIKLDFYFKARNEEG